MINLYNLSDCFALSEEDIIIYSAMASPLRYMYALEAIVSCGRHRSIQVED